MREIVFYTRALPSNLYASIAFSWKCSSLSLMPRSSPCCVFRCKMVCQVHGALEQTRCIFNDSLPQTGVVCGKPESSFRVESGGRVKNCRRFWALSLSIILAPGFRAFPAKFALYFSGFRLRAKTQTAESEAHLSRLWTDLRFKRKPKNNR